MIPDGLQRDLNEAYEAAGRLIELADTLEAVCTSQTAAAIVETLSLFRTDLLEVGLRLAEEDMRS